MTGRNVVNTPHVKFDKRSRELPEISRQCLCPSKAEDSMTRIPGYISSKMIQHGEAENKRRRRRTGSEYLFKFDALHADD